VLECVVNVSEGRRGEVVDALAAACGGALLDVHSDPWHNRCVFTLAGSTVAEAARSLAAAAVASLDLRTHAGVHPRLGVVDVVPFVPLGSTSMDAAVRARDEFAAWLAGSLGVPCFLYGPERTLPEVRRGAWRTLAPDVGPTSPHATAGSCAVGARAVLVAYNVWLRGAGVDTARRVAGLVRARWPGLVRSLGLEVGDGRAGQVSCNLVAPEEVGPAEVFDLVAAAVGAGGVERAELVGLVPASVLAAVPRSRWEELDLSDERTIEHRLSRISG
jgi:glutamate formiminotransferase